MNLRHELVTLFARNFTYRAGKQRYVGMEGEFPLVNSRGEAVDYLLIRKMYAYLEQHGFLLKRDKISGEVVSAERGTSSGTDVICTDLGYSIIEIAPAPVKDLFALNRSFAELMQLVTAYLTEENALVLGYGIQPLTPPDRRLITPKSRYQFFRDWSANRFVRPEHGHDSDFLGIMASTQTHVDVSLDEAVRAVNVLNALSGLHIILHANSPIWKGKVDGRSGAMRELLWSQCFPDREEQIGMAAEFTDLEDYVQQLCAFKMQTVEREGHSLIVSARKTFLDFLTAAGESVAGKTVTGEYRPIVPVVEDIVNQAAYAWFNGRLSPRYGTVEARACCQQPPGESLCSQALALGLIENLPAAEQLCKRFSWQNWQQLRSDALIQGFSARTRGESVLPLLNELLDIAEYGLRLRRLGEEVFLAPLRERLALGRAPADRAVAFLQQGGLPELLKRLSFNHTLEPVAVPQET